MSNEADIYNGVQAPAGKWFKLKDGQQARIRIFSDAAHAIIYQQEFTDKETAEIRTTMRFAYVIWNHDARKAQIWAGIAGATYDQIKRYIVNPEYGDITQYDVTVEREGESLQTKYAITAARKNYGLTAGQLVECGDIDLYRELADSKDASKVMTLKQYHEQARPAVDDGESDEKVDDDGESE